MIEEWRREWLDGLEPGDDVIYVNESTGSGRMMVEVTSVRDASPTSVVVLNTAFGRECGKSITDDEYILPVRERIEEEIASIKEEEVDDFNYNQAMSITLPPPPPSERKQELAEELDSFDWAEVDETTLLKVEEALREDGYELYYERT